MAVVDGHYYADGSEPSLGSIECTENYDLTDGKEIRRYQLLAADIASLPTYPDLAAGSSAIILDTGDYYRYQAYNQTWLKV